MTKIILAISIILNVVLVGGSTLYFIKAKGGLSYIKKKLHLVSPEPEHSSEGKHKVKISIFKAMPRKSNGIIFLGDSVIEGIDWAELFDDIKIKNRGIGGDWTGGVLSRLDEVLSLEPQKIFILLGGNDLYMKHARNTETDIKRISLNYEKILQRISSKLPRTKIFILSTIPTNQKWSYVTVSAEEIKLLNSELQLLAKKHGVTYIDLFSKLRTEDNQLDPRYTGDGLHLNGKGYLVFKKAIDAYVR